MTYRLFSLILPVRDQAEHIESAIEAYDRALAALPVAYELLIVPNGCSDDSPALCDAVAHRHATMRVLRSPRAGWGHAIRVGLAAARGDLVGYTNSARTSPDDLAGVVARAVANPGAIVTALRTVREGFARAAGSYLFNLECRALLGLSSRDINATPKVFPRTLLRLFEIARDDDLYDAEFHLVCHAEHYPIIEFPVESTRRHGGRSTMSVRSALRLFAGVARLRRRSSVQRGGNARGE